MSDVSGADVGQSPVGTLTPVDHDPFAGQPLGPYPAPPASSYEFGSLTPYTPSLSERIGNAVQDKLSDWGMSRGNAQDYGQSARTAAAIVPGVGNVLSGDQAIRDYQAGNYVGAGINALGAVPIPGAGIAENALAPEAERVAEAAAPGIIAYHGSPHSFDQFDISKIGTGEGAQAYGHGLYFAENEGVAQQYKNALAPVTVGGLPYDPTNPVHEASTAIASQGSRAAALQWAKNHSDIQDMDKVIAVLSDSGKIPEYAVKPGSMYQVGIAANPDHFLDWDKPLIEQHSTVQQALAGANVGSYVKTGGDALAAMEVNLHQPGAGHLDSAAVANYLRSAGIPGIKYADAGSRVSPLQIETMQTALNRAQERGDTNVVANLQKQLEAAQNPSRNYVVFDDKTINILKKYGIAGLGMAGAGAAAAGAEQPTGYQLTPVDHDPMQPGT